jgi:hypothetical protein
VYACELPVQQPLDQAEVYACALPVREATPRWQFWRRGRMQAREELRATLSPARLGVSAEETRIRFLVCQEAYKAAEAAKQCGDFETAANLRAQARAWAAMDPSAAGTSPRPSPALANSAGSRAEPSRSVMLEIRELPGSAREVWALVDVLAPAEFVWRTLTDYERLADIVPSLDENRVVSRWAGGARLEQVRAYASVLVWSPRLMRICPGCCSGAWLWHQIQRYGDSRH